jgi:hypothetical protein
MEEVLAAEVGTVVVDVQPAPSRGRLAPLVAQPSQFSGHLDLTELWRWVGGRGMSRVAVVLRPHCPFGPALPYFFLA